MVPVPAAASILVAASTAPPSICKTRSSPGNTDFTNIAPDIDNTSAATHPAVTQTFTLVGNNKGPDRSFLREQFIGTSGSPINPLLGNLTNNGGPTKTHALLLGSPAINAGDPAVDPACSRLTNAAFRMLASSEGDSISAHSSSCHHRRCQRWRCLAPATPACSITTT